MNKRKLLKTYEEIQNQDLCDDPFDQKLLRRIKIFTQFQLNIIKEIEKYLIDDLADIVFEYCIIQPSGLLI